MPGDFGGRANPLWTLYKSEAKSQDREFKTLGDCMNNYLIFVRSYLVHTSGFHH
jgi:hypothetical protein